MVEQKRGPIEYQAPSVADLGTLADLTAGANNVPHIRDLGTPNDSNGKSA
jgi:hypothetical protein